MDGVRQTIAEDGPVVVAAAAAGGCGRGMPAPADFFSESGHAGIASDYGKRESSALHFLAEQVGAGVVSGFARKGSGEFTPRSANGFASCTRSVEEGALVADVWLRHGQCSIQPVATQFPAFCAGEAEEFSKRFGVSVQGQGTLAQRRDFGTTSTHWGALCLTAPSGTTAPEGGSVR